MADDAAAHPGGYDIPFFESLTREDGRAFLAAFLRDGQENLATTAAVLAPDVVALDFSPASLAPAFEAVARRVTPTPVPVRRPDDPVVDRSRNWGNGPDRFDGDDRILVQRSCHYLGETVRRLFGPRVTWTTGDPDIAEQQQPVLRGFVDGVVLSPLLVGENLIRRTIAHPGSAGVAVDRILAAWRGLLAP